MCCFCWVFINQRGLLAAIKIDVMLLLGDICLGLSFCRVANLFQTGNVPKFKCINRYYQYVKKFKKANVTM